MELLQNGVVANEPPSQSLVIDLERPYGHTWSTPVTATLNGVDLGPAELFDGEAGQNLREPAVPASASFEMPLDRIERGLELELREGDERFVVVVPDFNAPRTVNIHTPLDGLVADQWIEVDSGVPSDVLDGGFEATYNDAGCFTQWGTERSATSIAFKMPPTHEFTYCGPGTDPAPGSTRVVDLRIGLDWSLTPITQCDGPDLTCAPVTAPAAEVVVPATLQF